MNLKRGLVMLFALFVVTGAILVLDPTLTPYWMRGFADRGSSSGSISTLGIVPTPGATGDQKVGIDAGELAPDFVLMDLTGHAVRLSGYRDKAKILINFWASWCGPCKAEMPDLEAVYREHQGHL